MSIDGARVEAAETARSFSEDVGGKIRRKLEARLEKLAAGISIAGTAVIEKLERDLDTTSADLAEVRRQAEEAGRNVEAPRKELVRQQKTLQGHAETLDAFLSKLA